MGSFIEINDTLRISKKQGFPEFLDVETHQKNPYKLEDLQDKIFKFTAKPKIRVYKIPPVRNFLVEDLNDKWIYWGLCHILSVEHDYQKQETGGTFKIIYLNMPDEMKKIFWLVDRKKENDYFS